MTLLDLFIILVAELIFLLAHVQLSILVVGTTLVLIAVRLIFGSRPINVMQVPN